MTTTTAAHSPTPWKAVSGQGAHYRDWYIRQGEKREDGSWPAVAKCCSSNIGARIVCESNAKFIETACNAHDDLLAACKVALAESEVAYPGHDNDRVNHARYVLRAAIARAEGGAE